MMTIGQSAAKRLAKGEGSTTISKESTEKSD
jgi:hypothetical protein